MEDEPLATQTTLPETRHRCPTCESWAESREVCGHCVSMEHLRRAAAHYLEAMDEMMAAYKAEPHPAIGELKARADEVAILLCKAAGVI